MTDLKTFITSEKFKTIIAIAAAVIMYFTPDPYDAAITAMLAAFGISKMAIKEEKQ